PLLRIDARDLITSCGLQISATVSPWQEGRCVSNPVRLPRPGTPTVISPVQAGGESPMVNARNTGTTVRKRNAPTVHAIHTGCRHPARYPPAAAIMHTNPTRMHRNIPIIASLLNYSSPHASRGARPGGPAPPECPRVSVAPGRGAGDRSP